MPATRRSIPATLYRDVSSCLEEKKLKTSLISCWRFSDERHFSSGRERKLFSSRCDNENVFNFFKSRNEKQEPVVHESVRVWVQMSKKTAWNVFAYRKRVVLLAWRCYQQFTRFRLITFRHIKIMQIRVHDRHQADNQPTSLIELTSDWNRSLCGKTTTHYKRGYSSSTHTTGDDSNSSCGWMIEIGKGKQIMN